jgi:hypothetical protein
VGGSEVSLLTRTSFGRAFTNLLYQGDLHFSPRNDDAFMLIDYLNKTYDTFSSLNVFIHDSEGINLILEKDIPFLLLFLCIYIFIHSSIH